MIATIALSSGIGFAQKQPKKENRKDTVEFFVTSEEMCHKCVRKVNDNLPFEKGVTGLEVNQKKNTIRITYRKDRTSPDKLKAAIKKLNMEVEEVKAKDEKAKE